MPLQKNKKGDTHMNTRERVLNILHYKDVDRMPALHFGYWHDLLAEWAAQGYIPEELSKGWDDNNAVDRALDKIIGWDFEYRNVTRPYHCNDSIYPEFPVKVIEELPGGYQIIQNKSGSFQKIRAGVTSIPQDIGTQLKDRESFETLYRPRMQFDPGRIDYDYFRNYNKNVYEKSDVPQGLALGSVYGTIRNIVSVIGMSDLMYDDDENLFADIIDTFAEMQYQCVEEILKTGAKFDFGHYWEDIAYKNGAMFSPVTFREIAGKHYKKRNELCLKYGIDIISLDCDGVTDQLLPVWIDNGVNVMFPIEIGTWGDQFEAARKKYGKQILGVGGVDKEVFRHDKKTVDAELERVKRLASFGGFIPCPDHRLLPGSKFELVTYYAEQIKTIL